MQSSLTIDAKLETLVFAQMGSALGVKALQSALLESVNRIIVPVMRRNAPIYSGDTQADVRAKIVDRADLFKATVIVGVDARKGHAGWRTKFIRFKGSKRRNDFVERSVEQTKTQLEADISKSVDTILEKFNRRLA